MSQPAVRKPRGRARRLLLPVLALLGTGGLLAAVAVEYAGVAPRQLAPYIERRASGHNPMIMRAGQFMAATLQRLDRGEPAIPTPFETSLGFQVYSTRSSTQAGAQHIVATADLLRAALAVAIPGDTITIAPGVYRFSGSMGIDAGRPGRPGAPIVVRALVPGSVRLEFDLVEGFRVSSPHWRFENLDIRGVCSEDRYCEHAFHVYGGADHFAAVNNTISDFNAHFKINGVRGRYPDAGLIEQNTLGASHPRETANPVTPIDLVGSSNWVIRANVISDFIKLGGNGVSFGAFAKGAGSGNVFERNLVWCERQLTGHPGQRVGLSLGGGGTGKEACRDGRCITEQDRGIIRDNLILGCSDVGIYLNSAADSRVEDNTIVDTAGIDVRFPTSSARLEGNLVDGPIRSRDGGVLHEGDNRTTPLWQVFAGLHPVRSLFADPATGDLRWRGEPPLRDGAAGGRPGLCGAPRPRAHAYGAFDDFGKCRPARP